MSSFGDLLKQEARPRTHRLNHAATMRFPSLPICGDESSTTSPILRKRFGDCALSVFLRDISAAVPAKGPDHFFGIVTLSHFAVDPCFHGNIAVIELADNDTRAHGSRAIEVLCQIVTD